MTTGLYVLFDITESAVYRFPVFTTEFCQQLVEEIKQFEKFPGRKSVPNTMNSYGVDHLCTRQLSVVHF